MGNKVVLAAMAEKINSINKDTVLVAIDGDQGSGKSTFLRELEEYLRQNSTYNVLSVETDDFLIERAKREHLPKSFFQSLEGLDFLFDFNQMAVVISSLLQKQSGTIYFNGLYNHSTGEKDRSAEYRLEDKNIILVGGPWLLSSELPQFDFSIFINATKENRLANACKRAVSRKSSVERVTDIFDKFESFYIPYYFERISEFDLCIDNNNFENRKIVSSVNIYE